MSASMYGTDDDLVKLIDSFEVVPAFIAYKAKSLSTATTAFTAQEKTIGEKYSKAVEEKSRRDLLAKASQASGLSSSFKYSERKELIGVKRDWKRKGETKDDLSTKSAWETGDKAHKCMHYAGVRIDRMLASVAEVPEDDLTDELRAVREAGTELATGMKSMERVCRGACIANEHGYPTLRELLKSPLAENSDGSDVAEEYVWDDKAIKKALKRVAENTKSPSFAKKRKYKKGGGGGGAVQDVPSNPYGMRMVTRQQERGCYRCGQQGHVIANCTNPPRPGFVQR